jgi:hypothetical protein
LAAAEQVQMKMEDGLTRAGAVIDQHSETGQEIPLSGQLGGNKMQAAEERRVGGQDVCERREVLPWADEDVRGRLRVNVFERKDLVVLEDNLRGNLPRSDLAEDAIVHENLVLGYC